MIVRRAQVVLVDAAGGETAMSRRRLPIRRRAGDRRERAGGRAEDRRDVRLGARHRRHAEGRLRVAGSALRHGPTVNGFGPVRRILLPRAGLGRVAAAGFERAARHQLCPLVVHGDRDLPEAGGFLEGRGPTVVGCRFAADRVLTIGLRLDGTRRLLVRLVLRGDHG